MWCSASPWEVRLLRHAKGLRMLSNTVLKSVPALANMFSLLCLLLFVFAVLGVAVFGKVPGAPGGERRAPEF